MLVDVTPLGVTGKEAEALLDEIGITVNKNAIPFDALPPNTASGIRLGTPATTTRGFGPDEMRAIARMITDAIARRDDARGRGAARARRSRDDRRRASRFPACSPRPPGELRRHGGTGRPDHRSARSSSRRSSSLLATPVDPALRPRAPDPRPPRRAAGPRRPLPRGGGVAVVDRLRRSSAARSSSSGDSLPGVAGVAAAARREPRSGLFGGAVLATVVRRARRPLRPARALAVPRPARPGRRRGRRRDHRSRSSATRSGPDNIQFTAPVGIAFTVVWIVGMINSLNFIDGLDGLSSGIALIAALTLGVLSLTTQVEPAAGRGAVLRPRRRAARLPALELPPGRDLPGHAPA